MSIFVFPSFHELIKLINLGQRLPQAPENQSESTSFKFRDIGRKLSGIINFSEEDDISEHFGLKRYILIQALDTPLRKDILKALKENPDFKTLFKPGDENREIDLDRELFPDGFSCKETFDFKNLDIKTSKLGIVKEFSLGQTQINLVIHLEGDKIKGATREQFKKRLEVPIIGNINFGNGAYINIENPNESYRDLWKRSSFEID